MRDPFSNGNDQEFFFQCLHTFMLNNVNERISKSIQNMVKYNETELEYVFFR